MIKITIYVLNVLKMALKRNIEANLLTSKLKLQTLVFYKVQGHAVKRI